MAPNGAQFNAVRLPQCAPAARRDLLTTEGVPCRWVLSLPGEGGQSPEEGLAGIHSQAAAFQQVTPVYPDACMSWHCFMAVHCLAFSHTDPFRPPKPKVPGTPSDLLLPLPGALPTPAVCATEVMSVAHPFSSFPGHLDRCSLDDCSVRCRAWPVLLVLCSALPWPM